MEHDRIEPPKIGAYKESKDSGSCEEKLCQTIHMAVRLNRSMKVRIDRFRSALSWLQSRGYKVHAHGRISTWAHRATSLQYVSYDAGVMGHCDLATRDCNVLVTATLHTRHGCDDHGIPHGHGGTTIRTAISSCSTWSKFNPRPYPYANRYPNLTLTPIHDPNPNP